MLQELKLCIYNWLTNIIPIPMFLRIILLRLCGVRIGRNISLGSRVIFKGGGEIAVGDDVKIYDNVYILCRRGASVDIGSNVTLATNVYIESGGDVRVGNNTCIFQHSLLTANHGSRLLIGDYCQIAHMVSLKTSTHVIDPCARCIAGKSEYRDIIIGDGAWLCAYVVIIPGIVFGNKSIAAAGSVVISDVPDYVMVAGTPAVIKKYLKKEPND